MKLSDPLVRRAPTGRPGHRHGRHRITRHAKAPCLKVLGRLSAYLDDELTGDLCKEIRRHLNLCPGCELFLTSLRDTVMLCRECPPPRHLSPTLKARLRAEILKAIGRS